MTFRYVFVNPELLFKTVKGNMKLTSRGAMSREDLATSLREIADKLERKQQSEQLELEILTMDEVRERVKQHVGKNRARHHGI